MTDPESSPRRAARRKNSDRAGMGDGPVFVDSSGRRLRRVRHVWTLAGILVAGYLVLLMVALFGGPNVAAPYLPRPVAEAPRGAPEPRPAPSGASPAPTPTGPVVPAPAVAAAVAPAPQAPAPTATTPAPAPTAEPVPAQPAPTEAPGQGSGATAAPGQADTPPGQIDRPTRP
ncbi:hypothetical protein [Sinomonas halotolerans]|uniref:Uncharacterized protein n=1 Tax=Sinomonas halotolerans TaxID=1644133 RepID=A0ABU9X1T2_9MICC